MTLEQVITVVKALPPDLRTEVGDFALYLRETKLPAQMEQHRQQRRGTLRHMDAPTFRWMGALKDLRNEYTSVELQHRALELRLESMIGTGK